MFELALVRETHNVETRWHLESYQASRQDVRSLVGLWGGWNSQILSESLPESLLNPSLSLQGGILKDWQTGENRVGIGAMGRWESWSRRFLPESWKVQVGIGSKFWFSQGGKWQESRLPLEMDICYGKVCVQLSPTYVLGRDISTEIVYSGRKTRSIKGGWELWQWGLKVEM